MNSRRQGEVVEDISQRIGLVEGDSCVMHKRMNINLPGRWIGRESLKVNST